MREEFIFVKNSLLYFYRKVPLYYYSSLFNIIISNNYNYLKYNKSQLNSKMVQLRTIESLKAAFI